MSDKVENLNLERTFFELWKRVVAPGYTGVDGMPGLTSKDVKRPDVKKIVVSDGARWTRLVIQRAMYVWTPDFRQIDYLPGHHPGDISADTAKPFLKATSGTAKLWVPGEWHLKTPLDEDDSEGDFVKLLVSETPSGFEGTGIEAGDLSGAPTSGSGAVGVTVMQAPATNVDIDTASETLIPKDRRRRYLFIQNTSPGGQTLWLAFGTAAVLGRGISLAPGEWYEQTMQCISRQSVQVLADANNATATYQVGR